MRVFSHTCSNTEIVCALGCAHLLIGVDRDSDYPPEVVENLPRPGRDLELDVDAVLALQPDLVLTSLTVPGHERIVAELEDAGVRTLVCDPQSLDDVFDDIRRISEALGVPSRGEVLVDEMQTAMPLVTPTHEPTRVLLEWWPKPVIAPARGSWASDLIARAGGINPWASQDGKSISLSDEQILLAAPQLVVMSWCGVKVENYRPEVVRRRPGWTKVPAVAGDRIRPISEAFLGRPGPRLVEGYRQLRDAIAACT